MPSASATRAAQTGEYQYATPEELLKDTRASIHPRILSIDSELKFDKKFQLGKCEGDSINIAGKIPVEFNLNPSRSLRQVLTAISDSTQSLPSDSPRSSSSLMIRKRSSWLVSGAIPSPSSLVSSPWQSLLIQTST